MLPSQQAALHRKPFHVGAEFCRGTSTSTSTAMRLREQSAKRGEDMGIRVAIGRLWTLICPIDRLSGEVSRALRYDSFVPIADIETEEM
jgi:hypothetical protein